MQPTPDQISVLNSMNLAYRFHDQTATYKEDPVSGRAVIDRSKPGPCVVCDVFDKTTNEQFYSAKASTESEALANALIGAIAAPKPLTAAQKADPRFAAMDAAGGVMAKRIAELEAIHGKVKESNPKAIEEAEAAVASDQEKASAAKAAQRAAKAAATKKKNGTKPNPLSVGA